MITFSMRKEINKYLTDYSNNWFVCITDIGKVELRWYSSIPAIMHLGYNKTPSGIVWMKICGQHKKLSNKEWEKIEDIVENID